jgi:acyl-CoA synthetase (AMP-forming)/AMP-acid ligase II
MRLHDLLDYQARERPDNEFALHRGRCITYREAAHESARLAHAFRRAGLGIGDRAAFLSKNSIEHVLLYFAASRVGVVPVPLNFRLPPEQWRIVIEDAGARILIASKEFSRAVENIRHELRSVEHYVSIGTGAASPWIDYHAWLAAAPASRSACRVTPDHDLYQFYTSGTTGRPKGAVITHRALIAHLVQVTAFYGVNPDSRILVITPLSHAHAAIQAFISACWGSCLYIMDEFDPARTVEVLSEERISVAVLVPSMIRACLVSVPGIEARRFDSLRLMHYGASPIAEHTLRRAIDVFRCDFVQGYGMTETTAGVTFLLPADHRRGLTEKPNLLKSAGRPALGIELRIVDEDDNPLPPDEVGQVIARGPTLMRGYWNMPEESAVALRGGWMHTGDLGAMDDEGYLYIVDRANDVINAGGENVYPRMVEEVLFRHPAIADAAAIGVPDDQWGEAVKGIVVLRQGTSATALEILEFCRERLAGFQQPRSIELRDALPYTASGKVLRRALREPYWTDRQRRVGGA